MSCVSAPTIHSERILKNVEGHSERMSGDYHDEDFQNQHRRQMRREIDPNDMHRGGRLVHPSVISFEYRDLLVPMNHSNAKRYSLTQHLVRPRRPPEFELCKLLTLSHSIYRSCGCHPENRRPEAWSDRKRFHLRVSHVPASFMKGDRGQALPVTLNHTIPIYNDL